ncbi:MAG: hypothetical protein KF886_25830 [Candidatus Hydrogenedentes bacterium]|nr:hypothetical protein [Candidatus Hydrogenedentota bacterium]
MKNVYKSIGTLLMILCCGSSNFACLSQKVRVYETYDVSGVNESPLLGTAQTKVDYIVTPWFPVDSKGRELLKGRQSIRVEYKGLYIEPIRATRISGLTIALRLKNAGSSVQSIPLESIYLEVADEGRGGEILPLAYLQTTRLEDENGEPVGLRRDLPYINIRLYHLDVKKGESAEPNSPFSEGTISVLPKEELDVVLGYPGFNFNTGELRLAVLESDSEQEVMPRFQIRYVGAYRARGHNILPVP